MFSFLKSVITPASDEKAVAVVPSVVAAEVVDTVVTKSEETGPVLKEEITSIEEYNSYPPSEDVGSNLSSSGDAEIMSASREEVESTESEQDLDSFLEELTEDQPTMTTITTNTASNDANVHNGYALKEQSVMLPSVMEDPVSPVKEEKDDTWKNIISPVKLCEEGKIPDEIIFKGSSIEIAHQILIPVEESGKGTSQNNAATKKDISNQELSSKNSSQDPIDKVLKFSKTGELDPTNDIMKAENIGEEEVHRKDTVTESNIVVNVPISDSGSEGKSVINEIKIEIVPESIPSQSVDQGLGVQNFKSTAQLLQSTNQFLESTTQSRESTVKVPIINNDVIWQQKLDELEMLESKAEKMLEIADSNGEITEEDEENMEKGSEDDSAARWSDYNDTNNDDNDIQIEESNKDDEDHSGDDGNNNDDDDDDNENNNVNDNEDENDNENENDDNNICYGNIEDEVNEISGAYISDDENDDDEEDGDVITNIRDNNEVYDDYGDAKVDSSVGTATERSAAYDAPDSSSAAINDNNLGSSLSNIHGDGDGDKYNSSTPIPVVKGVRDLLPIDAYKEEILYRIKRDRVTIIHGETGCGKSSRLPVILLEDAEEKGMDCRMMVRTCRLHGSSSVCHTCISSIKAVADSLLS